LKDITFSEFIHTHVSMLRHEEQHCQYSNSQTMSKIPRIGITNEEIVLFITVLDNHELIEDVKTYILTYVRLVSRFDALKVFDLITRKLVKYVNNEADYDAIDRLEDYNLFVNTHPSIVNMFPVTPNYMTFQGNMKPPVSVLRVLFDTIKGCNYCGDHCFCIDISTPRPDVSFVELQFHSNHHCLMYQEQHSPFNIHNNTRRVLHHFHWRVYNINKHVKKLNLFKDLKEQHPTLLFPETYIDCLFYPDGTPYSLIESIKRCDDYYLVPEAITKKVELS